jgi:hypothetical protein
LLTVGLGALAVPAAASPSGIELDVGGSGFTASPTATLIQVTRMAPGSSASGVMGVRNTSGDNTAVSVQFVDVDSSEHGCTHPERAMGCDPHGAGQLGDALLFTIEVASSKGGPYSTGWTGDAAALQHGISVGAGLAARSTEWLRLTVALPTSVGNEVQSDTFGFNLRVALSGPGAAVAGASYGIAGVSTVRGVHGLGVGPQSAGGLAFTGLPMLLMIGAGVLLVVCGALVAMAFRERRQT